jgi:type IV secretory pathway TraG/TraD family ATPase VirD4
MLVVGPTQAGKTTSLVLPAVLTWPGALVLTSVKHDVVSASTHWRSTLGLVQRLDPASANGLTWNPLEGVSGIRHCLRVAHSLSLPSSRSDGDFWNALAVKLVGGVMAIAVDSGRSMFDVARAIEERTWLEWVDESAAAATYLSSFRSYDLKTLDGVSTTAEAMVLPWRFSQPLATIRQTVAGSNTLYLCSPRYEQASYEPLFRGALRMVLEEQQIRVDAGTDQPLLMILDEAANVASLDELDQIAATVAGLNVTLVTVIQDFAQLQGTWGKRAATIVNNHATRVVVSGLADPAIATFLPELTTPKGKDQPAVPLRRRRPGTALVVSGRVPVYAVRLRPWWRSRRLRRRGRMTAVATI